MQEHGAQTLNVNQDLQHQEQPHKLSNQLDDDDEMKGTVIDSQKKDKDKQGSESDDGDANYIKNRLKKRISQN